VERREYQLLIRGQPGGRRRVETRLCQTPLGERRLQETVQNTIYLRRQSRLDLDLRLRCLSDAQGRILRVHEHHAQSGADESTLDAGRVGEEMVTVRGAEERRVPFEPAAIDEWRLPELAWPDRRPDPGDRLVLRTYTSSTAGYADLEVNAVEGAPEGWVTLESQNAAEPTTRLRWELGPDRELDRLLASNGALLLELRRVPWGQAEATPALPPDLTDLMRLPLAGRPLEPDKVDFVRFQLTRVLPRVKPEDFEGPGQRAVPGAEPGSFTLETWRLPPPPPERLPPGLREASLQAWLEPTSLIQADHPEVIRLARELTGGAENAWSAALRLRAWVAREVDSSMGFAFASALDTLRRKKGDCSEMALLLTALGRAAGIPSRAVYGLVVSDGALTSHMWTEVWVGVWRPLDAALGGERVSPARIRLVEASTSLRADEAQYQAMTGLLLSGMQVTVEEAR
jgi:hypothetical protein